MMRPRSKVKDLPVIADLLEGNVRLLPTEAAAGWARNRRPARSPISYLREALAGKRPEAVYSPRKHETVPGAAAGGAGAGRGPQRPHRGGHPQPVRLADALRSGRGLSPAHHQEAAPALDRARAAVVPEGGHQRRLPARERGADLGRLGGTGRGAGAGLRQAVAGLGCPGRAEHRPAGRGAGGAVPQPAQPPAGGQLLESGRHPGHGPSALPLPVPVPRERGQALLPALPAQRRRVPGGALQHRLLRPAAGHGRPGERPGPGGLRAHPGRRPPVPQSPGAGRPAAGARAPGPASPGPQSGGALPV